MNKIKFTYLVCFLFIMSEVFAATSLTGTQKSFEFAFESLLKSDGSAAEEWDVEIGKLIKTHPTNFLKALKKYRSKIKRFDALLGNLGSDYVDDFSKQKVELKNRIHSLKSIRSEVLKPLAIECIEELNKQLRIVGDGSN